MSRRAAAWNALLSCAVLYLAYVTWRRRPAGGSVPGTGASPAAPSAAVPPARKPTGAIDADPNPVLVPAAGATGSTEVFWMSHDTEVVDVRVGATDGALLARSGPGNASTVTGDWMSDGTMLYLQDRTGDAPLTADHTLARVAVAVTAAASGGGVTDITTRERTRGDTRAPGEPA